MGTTTRGERMLGGLWGAIVGDALGVPVEFLSRKELERKPVRDMFGYGTHNQPPGTWSDDSSMALCTVESLLNGFDTDDLARRFIRWDREAYWTPWGQVFDIGSATSSAINRIVQGVPPEQAGGDDEYSNGNGSLMRILPVALKFADVPAPDLLSYAHRASSLTHRHPRSQFACGFYCLIVAALVRGADPSTAYRQAIQEAGQFYSASRFEAELSRFDRVLSGNIGNLKRPEIASSGYVIHTLEAGLWCFLTTRSFEDAVLLAVNLGEDTDTTGTVTGGLAGTYYGVQAIPIGWREQIARRKEIERLFGQFVR